MNADKTSVRLQSGSSYLSAISFGNLEDLFSPAGGQHILMREAQAKQTEVFDTITGKQVLAVDGDAIGWLDQDHFAVNNAGELLIYRLTQTAPVIRLATSIRSDAYEFYWDAIHQQLLNLDGNTIQAYHLTTEGIKSHTVFSGSADSTLSLRRGNATQVMLEQSFKDQAQALSLHAYMPEQLRFEKQFEVPRRPGSVKFDRNDSRWIYFRK